MSENKTLQSIKNRSALARQLGVSHAAVNRWFKNGRVPLRRCAAVSRLTGIAVEHLNFDAAVLLAVSKKGQSPPTAPARAKKNPAEAGSPVLQPEV